MPEYYLTARTPQGRTVTERVMADSPDAAVQVMRDRGHDDIVLHTDEVGALFPIPAEVRPHVTPRDYVGFRHFRGYLDRVLWLTLKLYRVNWWLFLLIVALLGARRLMEEPWDFWDGIGVFVLLLPLVMAPITQLFSPVRRYDQLIEAAAWGRWSDVLALLPAIQRHLRPHEVAFCQAQALAGLDRLDEALDVVHPFADGQQIPEWLYCCRLAGVYHVVGQREQALAVRARAAEVAPENPVVLIDLAFDVLRFQRDAARARRLLERARSHALSDLAVPFLNRTEGALALEKGDASEARRLLEESLEASGPFLGNPMMRAAVDITHALMALACAALGDAETAARHFQQAEPRLRALRYDDLLARCEKAGLRPR